MRFMFGNSNEQPLFFAQVREDPLLEIEALQPAAQDTIAVITSGGCTALSLIAAGAGRVVGIDLNASQNHLAALKLTALRFLTAPEARRFLGASDQAPAERERTYRATLRAALAPATRSYWDARGSALRQGVLRSGVTERFLQAFWWLVQTVAHDRARCQRLLACASLDEQRALYDREWNDWRWRALFHLLINRFTLDRTYDPAFFAHVENSSFADHFLRTAEHSLCHVPVRSNYFLHQMLTGNYPDRDDDALPPYLSSKGVSQIKERPESLDLVHGALDEHLASCPAESFSGFALSNICEWLTSAQTERLFAEVVRTARPGARLVFRNFVGWTEVPPAFRDVIVEDRAHGEALIARDRSGLQRRIAVCQVRKEVLA